MNLLRYRNSWTRPDALIIREAANLVFSRISLKENQAQAKAHVIYTLREARHCGFAVCTDAIRFKAVDIDLRSIADYSFIKACGIYGLPSELRFIYAYFNAYSIMRMPVQRFILATKKGSLARGYFEYPPWHKTEKEDMLKEFDIQISHGDPINYGDRGFKQVSDFEHKAIIEMRVEQGQNGKPLGMDKLADRLKRSRRTIYLQITTHNQSIQQVGKCNRCSRVRSRYARIEV